MCPSLESGRKRNTEGYAKGRETELARLLLDISYGVTDVIIAIINIALCTLHPSLASSGISLRACSICGCRVRMVL